MEGGKAEAACATSPEYGWFSWCLFLVTFLGKQKSNKMGTEEKHLAIQLGTHWANLPKA